MRDRVLLLYELATIRHELLVMMLSIHNRRHLGQLTDAEETTLLLPIICSFRAIEALIDVHIAVRTN